MASGIASIGSVSQKVLEGQGQSQQNPGGDGTFRSLPFNRQVAIRTTMGSFGLVQDFATRMAGRGRDRLPVRLSLTDPQALRLTEGIMARGMAPLFEQCWSLVSRLCWLSVPRSVPKKERLELWRRGVADLRKVDLDTRREGKYLAECLLRATEAWVAGPQDDHRIIFLALAYRAYGNWICRVLPQVSHQPAAARDIIRAWRNVGETSLRPCP